MASHAYEQDVIAWSREQASLLRSGKWSQLDIEHLADEIEDVGISESRELESRITLLLVHLLKWVAQPEQRGSSWENTIRNQRIGIAARLQKTPSLKHEMRGAEFLIVMWADTLTQVEKETGLSDWPKTCPFDLADAIRDDFWPDAFPA